MFHVYNLRTNVKIFVLKLLTGKFILMILNILTLLQIIVPYMYDILFAEGRFFVSLF